MTNANSWLNFANLLVQSTNKLVHRVWHKRCHLGTPAKLCPTSTHNKKLCPIFLLYALSQCFPTFSGSRHPYFVKEIFCGTPSWFKRYVQRSMNCNYWRHPSVPRTPVENPALSRAPERSAYFYWRISCS